MTERQTYPETLCIECMEHVTDAPVCPHCKAGTCESCQPVHYCYAMRERDEARRSERHYGATVYYMSIDELHAILESL